MNYKVLYRKYRPDSFESILGQDYVINTLKNSIINGNPSHAYIFSGPRGTGKTTTAKVFAKAINCYEPINGSPCGKCEACLNSVENPDIIEIDAASNNGVDQIRDLIDNIKLTPANSKYKVYIIDEVHMLTTSAFNALLLTLEEPPKHVIFILATTNVENVPITILSRCQRFDFQKISSEVIYNNLKKICKLESIDANDDALMEIAYISDGGMRDALSLLDQLSKSGNKITVKFIEDEVHIVSGKSIEELIDLIEENNIDKFLSMFKEFERLSIDYKTLIKKLIDSLSIRAKNIKTRGIQKRLNYKDYKDIIMSLSECLVKINVNVNPYNILEINLLEYIDSNNSIDNKEVEKEKTMVEPIPVSNTSNITNTKEEEKQVITEKNNKIVDIRINNCLYGAKKEYLEEAKELINTISNKPRIAGKEKAILVDSYVAVASKDYIVFVSLTEHSANEANMDIKKLESIVNKAGDNKKRIIFISESRWQKEKEKYINNKKNNVKYEFIEETADTETKATSGISDVFDIDKVEII